MKNKKSSALWNVYRAIVLITVLFSGGCVVAVGVSTGSKQNSLEVEDLFTAGTLLPDHSYYIQGSSVEPEAIIAIGSEFQLQSRLWEKVEWSEKELKQAAFWMQSSETGFCSTDGGYLLSPDGKQIGIWYSQRNFTTIKEISPGVVEVYPFSFQGDSPCRRQYLMDKL